MTCGLFTAAQFRLHNKFVITVRDEESDRYKQTKEAVAKLRPLLGLSDRQFLSIFKIS